MKIEEAHMLRLVNNGTLGKIEISRYSLSTDSFSKEEEVKIMEEVLEFLLACHKHRPKRIYASSNNERSLYIITMQFVNQSLCNLLLDFSRSVTGYRKLVELSGAVGMYQYDSLQPTSFHSTYLSQANYLPENKAQNSVNIVQELMRKIEESCVSRKKLELEDDI
ncbi:hypothetical protein IGI37_002181 [Enterococcus sp. AZ194]|uniref:hypothetical protein n=1 Tax=Enterococcus sp. AZ194 TaxID=2774629 RepID=UPI003F287205